MEEETIVVEVDGRLFDVHWDTEPETENVSHCSVCGSGQIRYQYEIVQVFEGDLEIEEDDFPDLYAQVVVYALDQLGDARVVCAHCEDAERGELHEDDFC